MNKISPLTVSSIASVSMTDVATVENVLKELFATMADLAKNGRNLRINFKVGSLLITNGQIQWQHSKEILRRNNVGQSMDLASTSGGTTIAKRERLSIMQSAITPSIAKYSRATSTDYDNFHMSNPNP